MSNSWYDNCLPSIKDVKPAVNHFVTEAKKIAKVKKIYVFGSFAENMDNDKFRVKDVNIIASIPFHSEDLIAINRDTLGIRKDILEEEGFDIGAVDVSKNLKKIVSPPIDLWAVSKDKKLLHWGPTICCRSEYHDVKDEAEAFASDQSGFNLHKASKSIDKRKEWYSSFKSYIESQVSDMPQGWYCSEEKAKNIIEIAKEI